MEIFGLILAVLTTTEYNLQACASNSFQERAKATVLGEMSEWLKEHAWKACVGVTLPRVRIPLSPPIHIDSK